MKLHTSVSFFISNHYSLVCLKNILLKAENSKVKNSSSEIGNKFFINKKFKISQIPSNFTCMNLNPFSHYNICTGVRIEILIQQEERQVAILLSPYKLKCADFTLDDVVSFILFLRWFHFSGQSNINTRCSPGYKGLAETTFLCSPQSTSSAPKGITNLRTKGTM